MRIDAHAHVCMIQGWHRDVPDTVRDLKTTMQANGIDHTILIPDNKDGGVEMPGLRGLMALLKGDNNFSFLGCPNILQEKPGDPEDFRDLLARGVIKGLKFFPGHDLHNANDERCWPYFAMCERLGAPVVIHTGGNLRDLERKSYNDPAMAVEMSRKYPGLKIVIAHFYWPKYGYCYETTKGVPNLYFDLSGVVDDDEVAGAERIREPLLKVLAEDPSRVIFGTDWPGADVSKHVAMVEALPVGDKIKEMIFSENARRVYRLSAR